MNRNNEEYTRSEENKCDEDYGISEDNGNNDNGDIGEDESNNEDEGNNDSNSEDDTNSNVIKTNVATRVYASASARYIMKHHQGRLQNRSAWGLT